MAFESPAVPPTSIGLLRSRCSVVALTKPALIRFDL
jgi:hypothetical protein